VCPVGIILQKIGMTCKKGKLIISKLQSSNFKQILLCHLEMSAAIERPYPPRIYAIAFSIGVLWTRLASKANAVVSNKRAACLEPSRYFISGNPGGLGGSQ
jgi:hypothetical protein